MISPEKPQKNILIIDDDQSVTQMLSMLLETKGYKVDIARNGEEAFQKVTSTTDLILLDLILPDQGGFEVCRKLKEDKNTIQIPVIVLSGKLLSEDIVQGLYVGADDYLTKPFDYEELIGRMEAVMRRGSIFYQKSWEGQGKDVVIKELRRIIEQELIVPFFQPIFLLKPFCILGFEALCRPKTKTFLANPELLFKAAVQFGCYEEMEMLSWKKAVEYASKYLTDEKLFLNCNPCLVEGQNFLTFKSIFDKGNIRIENVILEITERSAVSNFKTFYEQLQHYREYGFKFAVDDVGGGYSSLESIVETHPEVVKIDRHIIHDLHQDEFKRSVVKFVMAFCQENNILCIAEGIENKEELKAVMQLGVDAGQGYYLYRPTPLIDHEDLHQVVQNLKGT